jgi:hypothetical protein
MTAQSSQPSQNEIWPAFRRQGLPRQTDSAERVAPSGFIPEVTRVDTYNSPLNQFPTTRTRVLPSATVSPEQGIAGVVSEVHPETITVQCQVGNEQVEINLPSALFSPDLQSFGKTVSISLDRSGGYQRPVVQGRSPSPRDLLPGEAELDAWVDSL